MSVMLNDTNLEEGERKELQKVVAKLEGEGEEKGMIAKAKMKYVYEIAPHCEMKVLKDRAYFTYAIAEEYKAVGRMLEKTLFSEGEKIYEGPSPNPVMKAMKKSLAERGKLGKGGGTGY